MAARVLWLIKGLDRGGAETLLTLLAQRIDRDRFEIELTFVLPQHAALRPRLEDLGVRTTCLEARSDLDPRWVIRLRRLLRSGRYDLIHTHSPLAGSFARLSAPRGLPIIHTEHNVWSRYRRSTYLANALTFPRNRLVLAVSDSVAASIRRPVWMGRGRYPLVRTVRNAVDVTAPVATPETRAAARERLGIQDGRPVIGSIASLTPEKDHAGLLRALRVVREQLPDVLLLLIGGGPLDHEVRDTVERLGLVNNVWLLGARSDVLDLLPALDVFALSSHYEGLPVSILEAMAVGLPTVASAVGGVPEAVTDGEQGWLIPPGDTGQFAERLIRLLAEPVSRQEIGGRARSRVEDEFSIGRLVNDVEAAYAEVLQHRPATS